MKEEFLHKDAIALAQEPGFMEWVHGQNTSNAQKWDLWINKNPEIRKTVNQAKALIEVITFDDNTDLQEKENKIWGRITRDIDRDKATHTTRTIPIRKFITIAAIAASIILPLFIFLGDSNKIIKATNGEQLSYQFPDQSAAKLNSGSSIEYNPLNWETEREVILKGEAYFEVETGKPFEVVTKNGSVIVLGTSFNVLSRGNRFEISCLTGKVEVKTKEHTLVLNPGDAVSLNAENKRLEPISSLDDWEVDWLKGEYQFDNVLLREVFEEMERQFNVEINVPREILNLSFTGYFMTENIDTALYQVTWPMNLQSNKQHSKIVIKKSGTK